MKNIMEGYLTEWKSIPMFNGIEITEMESMFHCLGAYMKDIKRDDYVILCGDDVNIVGIILSGKIHMIREDLWRNKSLLMSLDKGDVKVLFLTFSHIIYACAMSRKLKTMQTEGLIEYDGNLFHILRSFE